MAFKVGGTKRAPRAKVLKETSSPNNELSERIESPAIVAAVPPTAGTGIVPIAIRSDLTVHVQGLPFNLTEREAKKIANVVLAMATADD